MILFFNKCIFSFENHSFFNIIIYYISLKPITIIIKFKINNISVMYYSCWLISNYNLIINF